MIRKLLLTLAVAQSMLVSCKYFAKKSEQKGRNAVARAYDMYLYPENLEGIVPANASPQDSLLVTKNYIDNWIHQQVVNFGRIRTPSETMRWTRLVEWQFAVEELWINRKFLWHEQMNIACSKRCRAVSAIEQQRPPIVSDVRRERSRSRVIIEYGIAATG